MKIQHPALGVPTQHIFPISCVSHSGFPKSKAMCVTFGFFFKDFIYFFIHERHREREREKEAETQAEGEAGSMRGTQRGTRFESSGSGPGLQAALNCCATGAVLFTLLNGCVVLPCLGIQ